MFTLSDLTCLTERKSSCKLLKPWWEVFMDYLVILMLMVSILAGTVLLSRDTIVCLPVDLAATSTHSNSSTSGSRPVAHKAGEPFAKQSPHNSDLRAQSPQGKHNHLVYQQYVFISQVCYHEALPWYFRLFPYLALLQTLLLLAFGSFWFHFPLTSARIEHFLAILDKCCESPWTSRALSHAALQENVLGQKEKEMRGPLQPPAAQTPAPNSVPVLPTMSHSRHLSLDSGKDSPFFSQLDIISRTAPPSPCPSILMPNISLSSVHYIPPPNFPASGPPTLPVHSIQTVKLTKRDCEQARALFERVRRFRSHCESSNVIYKVYLAQTGIKLLTAMLIMSYSAPLLDSVTFNHTCYPKDHTLLGYSTFECAHPLASLIHKLVLAYLSLMGFYGLLNIYTLWWILHSSLCQYSFNEMKEPSSLRDVPGLKNDLAFLVHMADEYDQLLGQRLSVFLSPVNETRLLEENLERYWGEEKLRSMTTVDTQGRSTLQLVALPRLPPKLFSLSQLQVLKLEYITKAKFTSQVANMISLRELHLCHCTAVVDPGALGVLQERLEVLHLTFTQATEVPSWVYSLRSLHELHFCGKIGNDAAWGRGWAIGSLRMLRHLRVLVLRGMVQRLPVELCEVAGSLLRLEIHNESSMLPVMTGLKRMVGLRELLLQNCVLEPNALLTLTNLRTLDLQHNNLKILEGLLNLSHLKYLSCLRLAYNHVVSLPATIGVLRGLELLDLAYNQLVQLPPALFTLRRLRRLFLTANLLQELPAEVKALTLLTELDLSGNRLKKLPEELFRCCLELRILNVAGNSLGSLPPGVGALCQLSRLDLSSNNLEALPAELGYCSGLRGGGLLVEDWLLHTLSGQVRDFLTQSSSSSDKSSEFDSRPASDCFPYYSAAQCNFDSALESRI